MSILRIETFIDPDFWQIFRFTHPSFSSFLRLDKSILSVSVTLVIHYSELFSLGKIIKRLILLDHKSRKLLYSLFTHGVSLGAILGKFTDNFNCLHR